MTKQIKRAPIKIRLYVPEPYAQGAVVSLNENQSHYLMHVMRVQLGDTIAIFNGEDGLWAASVSALHKKHTQLQLDAPLLPQANSPDVWLAYAPIKSKTELVAEKAVELGVAQLHVVYTRHVVVKAINEDKLRAHVIEACEQCERLDVPPIIEHKDLGWLLGQWPKDRLLLYADESGGGVVLKELLPTLPGGSYGVLIGPEGGFSADERQLLKGQPFVKPFSLGPRVLRADTAAIAALACIQAWCGDWHIPSAFEAT
ncbi:MAG: 16S rRNA (uracil(1498)-N(3))-methyltransferase [Rickettsiales bacterium]|nr:16S rRNA (uracil(1498)-N(3))-methyltransferase [Rickettsiales bacterium]